MKLSKQYCLKWDLIKLTSFCTSKEAVRKKCKDNLGNGRKIFASDLTHKGLISKIYKQLLQLNDRKTNTPNKKQAEDHNTLFSRDLQMPTRHMKICSTSLIIRGMQMRASVKYHLTLVRMSIIKNSTNNLLEQVWSKGECWRECKSIQQLQKTVWRSLRKLKIELLYDPAILLVSIYLDQAIIQKDTCTPIFIAASASYLWNTTQELKRMK